MIINADTLVVFDLDDTLYKESVYRASGINAVAEVVDAIYDGNAARKLREWDAVHMTDIWGELCKELDLPVTAKESFLWIYRLHRPNIKLMRGVQELLEFINRESAGVVILTDGRSVTQRLKVNALGLTHYPLYISEEWSSEKPSLGRFTEIQKRYPAKSHVYIGDNPAKDFKAPNQLGWKTIGLRGGSGTIHPQESTELPESYQPDVWVDTLEDIRKFLC